MSKGRIFHPPYTVENILSYKIELYQRDINGKDRYIQGLRNENANLLIELTNLLERIEQARKDWGRLGSEEAMKKLIAK